MYHAPIPNERPLPQAVASHDRDLLLARPGLSQPTFFAVEDGRILTSPSLAALVGALRRKPDLCIPRLASLVAMGPPDDELATPYEGVFRVPVHTQVRIWPDGRRSSTLLARAVAPVDITAQEAVEELRALLARVIARHAAGKRRIAIFCSGGVDSSALLASALAWARRASGPEIEALAIDFAAPGDDRPHLRALTEALGIVPLRLPPSAGAPFVRRMMVLDGKPFTSPNASDEGLLLEKARERGAEVVWTGMGGDDFFEGYFDAFPQRALAGDVMGAVRDAARLQVFWRDPGVGQAWELLLRPLLVRGLPHAVRRMARRRRAGTRASWGGPALREYWERFANRIAPEPARTASERYARFVRMWHLMELVDLRAHTLAELQMEHADPLLDDDVIAFVSSLPPMLLFHGGRARGLLREAMRGLVPDSVRLRTDKGSFEPAMAATVGAAGGFAAFEDLAAMRGLEHLGLVEPRAYREAFDALARDPEGWTEGWLQVWPALAVEAFVSSYRGDRP